MRDCIINNRVDRPVVKIIRTEIGTYDGQLQELAIVRLIHGRRHFAVPLKNLESAS